MVFNCFGYFYFVFVLFWQASEQSEIVVISHRGASGEEVEHPFSAYDLAIDYGNDYIEQDLVSSKEGTLYVSHDTNAKRLTGVDRFYKDMTDEEINNLRTVTGESIHTLNEVFKRYKDNVKYVIELKEGKEQVKSIINLIKATDLHDQITIQSFDLEALNKIKEIYPSVPTMALLNEIDKLNLVLGNKNINIVCMDKKYMNRNVISQINEYEKLAYFYTLNSLTDINKTILIDVDGFFTDYTAKALTIVKNSDY